MFKHWPVLTWLVAFQATGSHSKKNCPIYGLGYPKPDNLFEYDGIRGAASALDSVIGQYIDNANNTGSDKFSYSVEVFAASEEKPLWSHYWTAKNLATMNTTGVKTVDGNTVYRIGSLTKIFTMLTFLAEVGDSSWNEPIAKFIPEIAAMVENNGPDTSHSLTSPDWGAITIGALASQISGLMRDYSLIGELTQSSNMTQTTAIGLPVLADVDIPPCGSAPFVTPAYSDIGYVLLGYALEQMTGKSFQRSFEDKLVKPGGRFLTTWAFNMGNESPTGNVYSSASDLSAVGRAILKSTLLPWPVTRRWLRPVTFSSDPISSVGSPWGVRRLPLTSQNSTYQFATTYNKLGSIGRYSTLLAVIPDFDIGFSIAAAGEFPSSLVLDIADTLSNTYLPTLLNIARSHANATFTGQYTSENPSLNSSLTISVDTEKPGLGVGPWISNGTNLMGLVVALGQNISKDYWDKINPSVRLYPTGLWDALPDGGKKVGFKATFEDLAVPEVAKPFTTDCSTWVSLSAVVYGSQPLDTFIFEMDKDGKVVSVENSALRNRLLKVS